MGFDIDEQPVDDFTGVYKVEYFTNKDLIEIPRRVKPETYTIVHKKLNSDEERENKKNDNNKKESSILSIFSSDDDQEIFAEDFTVKKNKLEENTENSPGIESNKEGKTSEREDIDSEKEIIELIN